MENRTGGKGRRGRGRENDHTNNALGMLFESSGTTHQEEVPVGLLVRVVECLLKYY
jgi:hypothetical protein